MSNEISIIGKVDKEIIRQLGRAVAEKVRNEIKIVPATESETEHFEIKKTIALEAKNSAAGLTNIERNLICQYADHVLNEANEADKWLDSLPEIQLERAELKLEHPYAVPFFASILPKNFPDPEEMKAFTRWQRDNRHWIRLLSVGTFFLTVGFAGLASELLRNLAKANWTPPALFAVVGLLFFSVAAFRAKPMIGRMAHDLLLKQFLLIVVSSTAITLMSVLNPAPPLFLVAFLTVMIVSLVISYKSYNSECS